MKKLEPTDIKSAVLGTGTGHKNAEMIEIDRLREILQDLLDSNFTAWGNGIYKPSTITTYNDIKERFAVLFKEEAQL